MTSSHCRIYSYQFIINISTGCDGIMETKEYDKIGITYKYALFKRNASKETELLQVCNC